MGIIRHNITLKEQAQKSYSKSAPDQKDFSKYNVSVDGSEFEEYSFTGTKEQIDEQEQKELDKASFTPSSSKVTEQTTIECGKSITTTKSRQEGDLWVLQVRAQKLIQSLTPEQTETQESQEKQYGSKEHPKIVNTSVTAIQQSILFKEPYKSWDATLLGALKQYINGASPLTPYPMGVDSDGNPQQGFLQDILPLDADVEKAIKNPVYYVPSVTITISYWSETPISNMGQIGQEKAPSAGNFEIVEPYISVFMGASSSTVEGGGYQVQETYNIGQYDRDMLATTTTTTN